MKTIVLAALYAATLAGAVQAATLSSSVASFEQSFPTNPNGVLREGSFLNGTNPGPATVTDTADVTIAQFDPIFGTLTGVNIYFDITSSLNFIAQTPNNVAQLNYATDLSLTAGTQQEAVLDFDFVTFRNGQNIWHNWTAFDRELAQISITDISAFVGTGDTSFSLAVSQALSTPHPSQFLQFPNYTQPLGELATSIIVEYTFTPGVQTVQTTEGLLAFSRAFVPEVVLERNEASPVPLPAGAWMLLAGLAGLGVATRRRRAA